MPQTADSAPAAAREHQFVFYGDCCSGVPGAPSKANFKRVNAALQQTHPSPDFVLFLGDHIADSTAQTPAELRQLWDYWLQHEMAWCDADIPIFHLTSNHNTRNEAAEAVWREVFPDIPDNGPPGEQGLSYYQRIDDLLLVAVNTNGSQLGSRHVESAWLDATLAEHADARHKIVAGHHPVFPVNGYGGDPWCVVEEDGAAFWTVLAQHGVLAYLCSHVIAFDVQQHDGVLQVCSGGAGTVYGPGGFMGEGEYLHFVAAELDSQAFRLAVIDPEQRVRESYLFPLT
jgi:hypothetical protein